MTVRFFIQRDMLDSNHSVPLATCDMESIDVECPELEAILKRGGSGPSGYDYSKLIGAEILP